MDTIMISTLELINQFSKDLYGSPLSYIEGQGFFIEQQSDEEIFYESLNRLESIYPGRTKIKNKIYSLDTRKSRAELTRNTTATQSQHNRNTIATQSLPVGELSPSDIQLAEHYNVRPFDENLIASQKELANITYKLIVLCLTKAKKQKKSKTKIVEEFFHPAVEAAKEKDILKLEQIKENTVQYLGMQKRILDAKNVHIAEQKIWSQIKTKIVTGTVVIGIFLAIITFFSLRQPHSDKSQRIFSKETQFYSSAQIDSLITIYELENNTEVYPWREGQIKNNLSGNFTQTELFEMCNPDYQFSNTKPQQTNTTAIETPVTKIQPQPQTNDESSIGYDKNLDRKYQNNLKNIK